MKIKVYCGQSIQDMCGKQKHPVSYVKLANELVLSGMDQVCYSNSTDFIMALKYISEKYNVDVEYFLDAVSCGNDTEPIFEDFNKSLDLISELSGN